jgi:hypothetical protein
MAKKTKITSSSSMSKADFISELTKMSKDDINQFIKANGKKPKLICPFIVYDVEGDIALKTK